MTIGRTSANKIKIKTDGGLRAVECGCCDNAPLSCLMYEGKYASPSITPEIEYSASDLPDAITFKGVSLSRNDFSYGNTTNGVILENREWAVYNSGVRTTRPALFYDLNNDIVQDQYAATYLFSKPGELNRILTRVSRCLWQYAFTQGVNYSFRTLQFSNNKWILSVEDYFFDQEGNEYSFYEENTKEQGESQSSPLGQYGSATIS